MIKYLAVILVVCTNFIGLGQGIDLFTDRNVYGVGEQIWFRASLPQEDGSAVLYIDLFSEGGEQFSTGKFEVSNSAASGMVQIDPNLRTGIYFMKAYTKNLLSGTSPVVAMAELTIVNHYSAPLSKMKHCTSTSSIRSSELKTQTKATSDQVEVRLANVPNGEYTVSVVPSGSHIGPKQNLQISCSFPEANMLGFVENRSPTLKGMLINAKDKSPVQNALIVGSTIGKKPELHLIRTNDKGRFVLSFRSIAPSEVIYLVAPEIDRKETKFLVDQEFPDIEINCDFAEAILTDSVIEVLNRISFNAKISTSYGKVDHQVAAKETLPSPFTNPTEEVFLDDYIALGSMKEVFMELIPYAAVREKEGEKQITMYDHLYHKPLEGPLVLLDNVPFVQHGDILKLAPAKIHSIRVIANPYYYGDEKISGIVSIHSKNGRLGGLDLPKNVELIDFSGFQPNWTWQEMSSRSSGEAKLQNTLFWDPDFSVGSGEANISFNSGHHQGSFDVILMSTSNTNKMHIGTIELTP